MGRRGATGIWRRICAALLCLALAEPALSASEATHSEDEHAVSHALEEAALDGHHHDAPEIEIADHCHPGLDCSFQAILAVQAIPEPHYDIDRWSGVAADNGLTGTIRGFDPPPPRPLS